VKSCFVFVCYVHHHFSSFTTRYCSVVNGIDSGRRTGRRTGVGNIMRRGVGNDFLLGFLF